MTLLIACALPEELGNHPLPNNTPVVCASGDSFVTQHDPWLIEQGAHVVDMELFALAMACHQHGVAWRSFKYITDDANKEAGKDWATQVSLGQQLFRRWFEAHFFASKVCVSTPQN